MSDRDHLLASVLTHPWEDTPRLALADWFGEWGGCADRARAEFIRTQVERSRCGTEVPTGPGERALFAQWGYEWLPHFGTATHSRLRAWHPLAPLTVIRTLAGASELVHFERGFPSHYVFAAQRGGMAEQFAKRTAALFALAPVERFELEVENREPWVDIRIGPDSGFWRAELYVRAGSPAAVPLDELVTPDRQSLADGFERWVRRALADICFELANEERATRNLAGPRGSAGTGRGTGSRHAPSIRDTEITLRSGAARSE